MKAVQRSCAGRLSAGCHCAEYCLRITRLSERSHFCTAAPRGPRTTRWQRLLNTASSMNSRPEGAPAAFQQVLFVETGVGCDQHGQDAHKAAMRACRNAIEFNSIPSIQKIVPGGYEAMRLHVKIGCPHPEQVRVEELHGVFPYGNKSFEIVDGGLCCNSGIKIEKFGDTNDDMFIAVAAVTVGY